MICVPAAGAVKHAFSLRVMIVLPAQVFTHGSSKIRRAAAPTSRAIIRRSAPRTGSHITWTVMRPSLSRMQSASVTGILLACKCVRTR